MNAENLPEDIENRIRRNQADLKSHVQRIQYYMKQRNQGGCFSALVDLFIVLGSRGFDLRKRLISQSESLLSTDLHRYLEGHLIAGILADEPLPCATSSILTESISGTTNLVEPTTDGNPDQS